MSEPRPASAARHQGQPDLPGFDEHTVRQERWRQLLLGMRLFLIVGLVFAGMYVLAPEGPWKWLAGAVAMVSLVRGMWYGLQAHRSRPDPASTPPPTSDDGGAR